MKRITRAAAVGALTATAVLPLVTAGTAFAATPNAGPSSSSAAASTAAPRAQLAAPRVTVLGVDPLSARIQFDRADDRLGRVYAGDQEVSSCPITFAGDRVCTVPITASSVNAFSATQSSIGDRSDESARTAFTIDTRSEPLAVPVVTRIDSLGPKILVSVTGKPGATVDVRNSNGQVVGRGDLPGGRGVVSVDLRSDNGPVPTHQFTVAQHFASDDSARVAFRSDQITPPAAPEMAAPVVTGTERQAGGTIRLDVATTASDVVVRSDVGQVVGRAHAVAGVAHVIVPDTGSATRYTVTAATGSGDSVRESAGVPVVVNASDGPLVPVAPAVDGVSLAGVRAVVTASGTPGAVATVRSPSGTVLALKKLDAKGAAQLSVPASARTDAVFTLTQKSGDVESEATAFHLTATR